jgi:hypothetical protein
MSGVRVLVSGGRAASLRAAHYAQTLGIEDTSAVYFADDSVQADRMEFGWRALQTTMPLEIDEAPYRDIGDPLLAHLREITADPETVAVAVLPELVVRGCAMRSTTSGRSTSSAYCSSRRG